MHELGDALHRARVLGDESLRVGPCDVLGIRRIRRLLVGGIFGCADDVRSVQKGGALEADVDERGLHARQHAAHATLVDIAYEPAAIGALDGGLLEHAVFNNGHPGFTGRDVDEQLGAHAIVPFSVPGATPLPHRQAAGDNVEAEFR